MKQATSLRQMPLWKWILLLVGGLLLTVFAQAFASSLAGVTEDTYLLAGLFLLASTVLIGIYLGAVRLFGRRNALTNALGSGQRSLSRQSSSAALIS